MKWIKTSSALKSMMLAAVAFGILCLASGPVQAEKTRLNEGQHAFSVAFAHLILYAQDLGYTVSIGRCHDFYAREDSLHRQRLACDLHLFKDGRFLRNTQDYRYLGQWWIRYGQNSRIPLRWGGTDNRADGNHFSYSPDGRRW